MDQGRNVLCEPSSIFILVFSYFNVWIGCVTGPVGQDNLAGWGAAGNERRPELHSAKLSATKFRAFEVLDFLLDNG
jgi:hypothetical protein